MGSGKSEVGSRVAALTRARFYDLDAMIERAAGMGVSEIFDSRGESGFRELEKQLLPGALEHRAVIAVGGGAVMDDDSWRLVSQSAVTVYLEAPFAVLWERVRAQQGRPLIAGRRREDVEGLFEKRRARYEEAAHRVHGDRPVDEVAAEVIGLWSA